MLLLDNIMTSTRAVNKGTRDIWIYIWSIGGNRTVYMAKYFHIFFHWALSRTSLSQQLLIEFTHFMGVALSSHIMIFVLQLAMLTMIFVTVWLMKILIIVFLNIADDCQSICNRTLRRQRVIFSTAGACIEDGDADVDSDDIMTMTTEWWYG